MTGRWFERWVLAPAVAGMGLVTALLALGYILSESQCNFYIYCPGGSWVDVTGARQVVLLPGGTVTWSIAARDLEIRPDDLTEIRSHLRRGQPLKAEAFFEGDVLPGARWAMNSASLTVELPVKEF